MLTGFAAAAEQLELKQQLQECDRVHWCLGVSDTSSDGHSCSTDALANSTARHVKYLAGVDISFLKGSNEHACASMVVLLYPSMQVVYEAFSYVALPAPYISGFLAFREVPALSKLYQDLMLRCPGIIAMTVASRVSTAHSWLLRVSS